MQKGTHFEQRVGFSVVQIRLRVLDTHLLTADVCASCQGKPTRSSRASWQVRTLQGLLFGAERVDACHQKWSSSSGLIESCSCGRHCPSSPDDMLSYRACLWISTDSRWISADSRISAMLCRSSLTRQSIPFVSRKIGRLTILEILRRCRELSSARSIRIHHFRAISANVHFLRLFVASPPLGRRLS